MAGSTMKKAYHPSAGAVISESESRRSVLLDIPERRGGDVGSAAIRTEVSSEVAMATSVS